MEESDGLGYETEGETKYDAGDSEESERDFDQCKGRA